MKLSRILPLVVGGAVAGIVVSSASPAQALEFVTNGNFESGLTGWQNVGPGSWGANINNIGGNSSTKVISVSSATSRANLLQSITGLSVGQTYNFSFDYFQAGGVTNSIIVVLGSTNLASLINTTSASFTTFSTTFVATRTSDLLLLQGYNDPGAAYLDNVSLTDVATPVPFDIPGGATIPTVGSLFALGLIRQAKKRLAVKKTCC